MTRDELVNEIIQLYASIIRADGAFPPKPKDYIAPLRLMLRKDIGKLSELTGVNPAVIYSTLRVDIPAEDIRKDMEELWNQERS